MNPLAIRVPSGTVIEGRYRFETMSIGKFSTVFRVEDLFDRHQKFALKAEYDRGAKINYLHQEIAVLHKLANRQHVPRLYYCERCDPFSMMMTTLYGKSIWTLRQLLPNKLLTPGCAARIGVHTLYQLKQLHECGYIIRDLKVGDMLLGLEGNETKVVFIVDWGMCRTYVMKDKNGTLKLRPQREKALIRGILRYCSTSIHQRKDVSRVDDIWSLIYIIVDLTVGLPWRDLKTEEPVMAKKLQTSDSKLLDGCPFEWMDILKHVRSLKFESRPDYKLIFDKFRETLIRLKISYADPWDWDLMGKDVVVESLTPENSDKKSKNTSRYNQTNDDEKEESSSSSSEEGRSGEHRDKDSNEKEWAPKAKPTGIKSESTDPLDKIAIALQKTSISAAKLQSQMVKTTKVQSEKRLLASEYDPAFPTTSPAEFEKNDIGL